MFMERVLWSILSPRVTNKWRKGGKKEKKRKFVSVCGALCKAIRAPRGHQ
jgi:hypothetical protein